MTLQEVANKTNQSLKKHAPEILTALSVTGLLGTAYLGGRAGFKSGLFAMADAAQRIDATPDGEETIFMPTKDLVKETWKYYIPTLIVGVVTATCIVGSNRISNNRNLALISAAAIGERAFQEYREKTAEVLSKPKERKLHDDIAQDKVDEKKAELDKLVLAKDGDVHVIEMHTRQVFVSNAEKIHRAENNANRISNQEGYIALNVFLEQLGLPYSDAGEAVGWSNDRPLEVVIGGAAHDEKPVLTIDYRTPPTVTYKNPF